MTQEARGPDSPAGREAHDRHGGAAMTGVEDGV